MKTYFAFLNMGGWEIVLIFSIIILLFGASRLPKLAKGLGESIREFRKAGRELEDEPPTKLKEDV